MKNTIVKITTVAIIVIACMMSFTACKTEFKCATCGEVKKDKVHHSIVVGEEYDICSDCYEKFEALDKLAKQYG